MAPVRFRRTVATYNSRSVNKQRFRYSRLWEIHKFNPVFKCGMYFSLIQASHCHKTIFVPGASFRLASVAETSHMRRKSRRTERSAQKQQHHILFHLSCNSAENFVHLSGNYFASVEC